jgi:hypothetical protein
LRALREIFRILVAALPRYVLRGENLFTYENAADLPSSYFRQSM